MKRTKQVLLWSGLFLLIGGLVALLNEFTAQEQPRWGWTLAACLVSLTGGFWVAAGAGKLYLKDVYFSMTPEKISYRLNFFTAERVIYWNSIDSIQASQHTLLFELKDGGQVVMRLGNIQSNRIANHVSVSVQLAAIEQNVEVNGVPAQAQKVV
ncbi:hypothetical protein [Pontibacter sp. HJ8]